MPTAPSTEHLALPSDDIAAGLPVVIDDGSQCVYGAGLEEMVAGGNTYYYLADGLGSTMAIVDAAGAVQKSYTYDVYGKPTATGSLANEFDFAGQQTDPTGLQYLRARYMDPETGTFLRRDPMDLDPIWQDHPFAYVDARPTLFVDPSGLALVDGNGAGGGGKQPGPSGGGGASWKFWKWGRGGKTVGEYPKLPANDQNKIAHIFQPKHDWQRTGLSQKDNIALIERVAKNPGNKVLSGTTANGVKEAFEMEYNGAIIHVEVYTPPNGVPIVENAWVVHP